VDKEFPDTPSQDEFDSVEKEHGSSGSESESSAETGNEAQNQVLFRTDGDADSDRSEPAAMFNAEETEERKFEGYAKNGAVEPRGESDMKWYVVHVYSGFEQKAKVSLQERIKQAGMESDFGDVLIPMETVQETRSGSTRVRSKTFYPGYIFVQMNLNDETWHVVRDTPKITGFVGGRYPRPVPPPEIMSVVQQVEEGAAKPRPTVVFEQGDHVRVIDGAFANFTGTVEEIKPEKLKVRVLVSIFGRATPVELDYSQVEKTV
jgi:transcriptional antiterminator NusG